VLLSLGRASERVPFPAGALSENADGYAGATRRGPTRSPLLLAKGKTAGAAGEERDRQRERERESERDAPGRARARTSRENSRRLASCSPRDSELNLRSLSLSSFFFFFPLFLATRRDDGWGGEVFTMVPPFVVTEVISGREKSVIFRSVSGGRGARL